VGNDASSDDGFLFATTRGEGEEEDVPSFSREEDEGASTACFFFFVRIT